MSTYQKRREYFLEQSKQYYRDNIIDRKAYNRQYYLANREKLLNASKDNKSKYNSATAAKYYRKNRIAQLEKLNNPVIVVQRKILIDWVDW